jgi:hypothetical protein
LEDDSDTKFASIVREIERESGWDKKVGRTAKSKKIGGELPGVESDKITEKGVNFLSVLTAIPVLNASN